MTLVGEVQMTMTFAGRRSATTISTSYENISNTEIVFVLVR